MKHSEPGGSEASVPPPGNNGPTQVSRRDFIGMTKGAIVTAAGITLFSSRAAYAFFICDEPHTCTAAAPNTCTVWAPHTCEGAIGGGGGNLCHGAGANNCNGPGTNKCPGDNRCQGAAGANTCTAPRGTAHECTATGTNTCTGSGNNNTCVQVFKCTGTDLTPP